MTVMREHPGMPTGENKPTPTALRGMRRRWLEPSPPLAVDDEPHWRPAPDPEGAPIGPEDEAERPAAAPAA